MIIYIDVKTLALTTEGHVPLTDMALVRGDKIPLRIVLTDGPGLPADTRDVPVLAVKKSLGDDALVLAATGLERVEDALGVAYVGSLSVNTTQLAEVMGDQDRIDLIGEVVLVAPDGAQRTSRLVRVTVRADLLPGDYEPPTEVLADWHNLIAAALAARLPDALHDAGVYLTPVPGTATLTVTGGALAYALGYYRLPLAASAVVGHIAGSYNINRLTITAPASHNNGTAWMMRLWRAANGTMSELGISTDQATWAATDDAAKMTCSWEFDNIPVAATDIIVLQVYDAAGSSKTIQGYARQVGTEDGMGICTVSAGVPQIIHTCAMGMTLDTTYQDGIAVGGVELATKDDFNVLTQDVITTGEQVYQDAQSASDAATAAQQALAAMPQVDANGNMTLPGNLAAQGGTFAHTVNANGGVNIPLTATPSAQTHAVNRVLAGGMAVVADACNPQVFLSSRTTYGASVSVTDVVPNFLWQLKNSASGSSPVNGTVRVGFDSALVGRSNYGTIWGYVIPYRPASSKHKVTFTTGMFRESECVISTGQPIDTFTVSPKPSNKSSWLRIIDITFYNEMDSSSVPVGYPVRVREMVYDKSNDKWVVYTTMSVISAFNTQFNNTQAIVYQQNPDDTGCQAGLWLIVQGAAGQRTLRLADLHGVSDSFGWDTMSPVWWDAGYGSAHIGAPRVAQVYSPDRVNGAYHAFTSIESRQIQSTSSADFNCYE